MSETDKNPEQVNDIYDEGIIEIGGEEENDNMYKWLSIYILLIWVLSFFVL